MKRVPEEDSCDGVAGSSGAEPAPRSVWRLLLDPNVGVYFGARLAASIGIWIKNVVAAVVVYDISGSALMVGAVSVAQFGTQILLTPYMGALADRGNRQRQAAIGHTISALGSGGLAAWILLSESASPTSPWPVIASAFVVGIGFTVGAPAAQALVPSLARPAELAGVIVLISAPMTVARAIGPGLGALILVTLGPAVAFGVTAASMALLAVVVMLIRLRPVERLETGDKSVRGGFRYLRSDTAALVLLVAVACLGFGIDPIITLSPAIADGFGAGTDLVAQIASAFGIGAAFFLIIYGILRRLLTDKQVSSSGLITMSISMVGLGLSTSPEMSVAFSLLGGIGMMAAMTSLSTQIQKRVPEEFRGRIMALWLVAFIGSRPLAAAANGAIADTWSPTLALLMVAVLLAGAAVLSSSRSRGLGRPAAPAS